jgi:hypothetical protein
VAVAGKTVYVADLKGVGHAINLADGKKQWALDLGTDHAVNSPPPTVGDPPQPLTSWLSDRPISPDLAPDFANPETGSSAPTDGDGLVGVAGGLLDDFWLPAVDGGASGSGSGSAAICRTLSGPFELIVIDTLHDAASVARDIASALLLLAPGGLVAFHDYPDPTWPEVRRVVDEHANRLGWKRTAQADFLGVFRM